MTRTRAKEGALSGRRVALTGRLASMNREEALTFLDMVGAIHDRTTGIDTDFLVVGEGSRPLTEDGHPTASLAAARSLRDSGATIEILSETQFLALLGLEELLRLYTTQQLGRILKIPAREITAWVRRGLVRPVKVVHRLCYFDFAQVASAKFLLDLIRSGVPISRIRDNLREMESWYPGAGKSLVQLGVMERHGQLMVRLEDGSLADPRGQLQFEFGSDESRPDEASSAPQAKRPGILALPTASSPNSALAGSADSSGTAEMSTSVEESWFEAAMAFEEARQLDDAAVSYQKALAVDGPSVELAFNLGNVLYGLGRKEESVQRFLQAVELEPDFHRGMEQPGQRALRDRSSRGSRPGTAQGARGRSLLCRCALQPGRGALPSGPAL